MEHTIIQPDESQTFLFKYGPYGEEHYFTVQEILQKMRVYYQQDFDSIVLLPYAYDAFGYFIAGCQIWDGSANEIYLQNEEIMSIGYDYVIAVRPLYSNTMPMCAFGTDGQTSYSFGTTSMGTYYDGPPDYYIWNCFRGDYPVPFIFYTECDCPHIFINGTEYHSGDATVRVNYYLPDSDYEYARITYKKNDKPESVNDGTIVPISPSDSYIDIENLVEGKSYYFKIFTSKSESEAFPFLVPELIDYGNMIFNDNSEITAAKSSYTASTTPKFLVDMYKEKSTQSGYAYMNANANTWLIGPANNANGYSAIFGWTLPTDKDIYIVCQNDTGQNAYYVWIWWDGFTSRDMLGTNCGYYKEINVLSNGTISQYQAATAINCYSGFSNNLTIDGNRYWSQTWLGGNATLKPIVWTEVNTSRIWVNGKKLT